MKFGYFDWDGVPAVVGSNDRAAWLGMDGAWMSGDAKPILGADERDCPKLTRDWLSKRFASADLTEGERLVATAA